MYLACRSMYFKLPLAVCFPYWSLYRSVAVDRVDIVDIVDGVCRA